ncbi:NAD-dependent epimerase/dehydratase family protein [Ideonella sp. DXS22W]|uniref:NAD-dependent epimerase/dehydratase family protein n=1 Tax=Pseudaquabacterium inlustre TaxID=2984192 RepID=A0ABU9CH36_9BURK
MRLAITGARGFMGSNLRVRLGEQGHTDIVCVPHDATDAELATLLHGADLVYHLAGVNRPPSPDDYQQGNAGFTERLCRTLTALPKAPALAYASSTQAALDNAYGRSKLAAEQAVQAYGQATGADVHVYRLPNVFGKWSSPNYNSAVATFCHNVARDLPITVNDPAAPLRLVYIDDVTDALCTLAGPLAKPSAEGYAQVVPVYDTTVGEIARTIQGFRTSRDTLVTDRVGAGLVRALYATYVSFLPVSSFGYEVPRHGDARGVFVEMLKTPDCGQFSYFTAHPGVTRGEHYHHTKTEKFLVIKGTAHFGFRHIVTDERHGLVVEGGSGQIVETVPGWTHNISNIGQDELIVMLWANEIFDRDRPDTTANKVDRS